MGLLFEVLTVSLCSILTATFIGLYFYFIRNFNFWKKLGVPYVRPVPFFGTLKDCVLLKVHIGQYLQQIYEEHSDKPYVGIFSFDKPSLLICDLELAKNITVRDSQSFSDHVITFNERVDPLIARSVIMLKGQDWRQVRSCLTPVFTSNKMKLMFHLVDTCGKELADYLDKVTLDGSAVDVTDTMCRYTTDVIASCAFGINSNSLKDPDAEFRRYLKNVFDFSVRSGLAVLTAFFAPYITEVFKLKFVDDITNNYVRKTVWNTVEYREKHGLVRNDFLDCMIELRNKGKKSVQQNMLSEQNPTKTPILQIDGDMFVGQAFFFIVAGYETSGTTMTYALYELAMHPEIQDRLRAEILQVLNKHNGDLTYDGVQEMSYLDMVVSETMRKYPPITFLDRMCCRDYELPRPNGDGTITIPAGTGVYIPVLAFHHDPSYFPEPKKFDPERFTEENKSSRPNYTYMPFGEGPRICLGLQFALMQVKTGLCHVLSRFEVAPCKDTPVSIAYNKKSFMLLVDGKLPLSFKRT